MDTIVKEYPATPDSIRNARALIAEAFTGHPSAYDARLLVTELATNAVKYGDGDTFTVEIQHIAVEGTPEIRVRVRNHNDGVHTPDPTISNYDDPDAESKRGLALVAEYAANWGYSTEELIVLVWFDFPAHAVVAVAA